MTAIVPIVGFELLNHHPSASEGIRTLISEMGLEPFDLDFHKAIRLVKHDPLRVCVPMIIVVTNNREGNTALADLVTLVTRRYRTAVLVENYADQILEFVFEHHLSLGLWPNLEIQSIVRASIRYCYEHLHDESLSLEEIAGSACVSRDTLERRYKHNLGCGVWEYVRELRIRQAKRLLAETDISIAEVGSAIGYSELAVFDRFFKRRCGISPRQFRQKVKLLR
jgi:transcriptional regulator GlxA family with amidase domain